MGWIPSPETPRERLWLWRVAYRPVRAVAGALFPLRVEGLEHRPPHGPYLLVSNHVSWYDPAAIEFALGERVRFMAKREIFAVPVLGFVLLAIGNFPVRRGESDRRALEVALRVLAAHQPLGYFPEGTRSTDGVLHRAKPGVAFLARRSGAPILPVGVIGTSGLRLRVPHRGEVLVRVGAPFTLGELVGADDQALADAIMSRVAALLPSHMRGVYPAGDH